MANLFSALLLATGLLTAHAHSTKDAAAPAGAQEMPAMTTAATGSFISTIQAPASSTPPSPAWGPQQGTGAPGLVFLPFLFNNATSTNFESPITGTTILSPAQAAALLANGVYANLHTTAQPGDEIRANLTVK